MKIGLLLTAGWRRAATRPLMLRNLRNDTCGHNAAELHSPNEDPHRALEHIAFTVAYNMSDQPAASVNWGYTSDGLPIGVQLVGQRFDDLGTMRLARAVELLRPAQRPWPNP